MEGHTSDATARSEAFDALESTDVATRRREGRAVQLQSVAQVPAVLEALGYVDAPYTVVVNGIGFHVVLPGGALLAWRGDWVVYEPDGLPQLVRASEFTAYWERS